MTVVAEGDVFSKVSDRGQPTQTCYRTSSWVHDEGIYHCGPMHDANEKSLRQHYDSVRSVRIGVCALPLSFQKMCTSKGEHDDPCLAVIQKECFCLSVHVRFSSSGRATGHADCFMSPQLTGFRRGKMDMSTKMNRSMNMKMTPTT